MRNIDVGKRMAEEMVLEQVLEPFQLITCREISGDWEGDFAQADGSPDFVCGFDGTALGIELAEIRYPADAWAYYETASRIAWKKHESYVRRGLFANPIALVLHSTGLPLFDIQRELANLRDPQEFEFLGFKEVWAIDFSDAYYSAGHPFRRADMFCFKPRATFGFHRIGDHGRKPYG